jgi:hypothetical protein
MIRHRLALGEPQELAQREAVSTAPFQAAFAVDAFEIADQQHAEVADGGQLRSAAHNRVVPGAQLFSNPAAIRIACQRAHGGGGTMLDGQNDAIAAVTAEIEIGIAQAWNSDDPRSA